MASPERSQKMRKARDEWLTTKDGRIATRPAHSHDELVDRVKHGFAVGYQQGQREAKGNDKE